jgi:hypothetical protein
VLSILSWLQSEDIRVLLPFLPAFHAAALEARRQGRLRLFLSSLGLVVDMLVNLHDEDYATIERDARTATWASLDRRQAEWHRQMVEIRRQEDEAEHGAPRDWSPGDRWAPLLGHHSDADGDAVEIVDARGLDEEALELAHCVDGYAPYCIAGVSRIFSLRTGEHRSTLELRRHYGVWHIAQNRGVENVSPDRRLERLGKTVAKAANQAARNAQRR